MLRRRPLLRAAAPTAVVAGTATAVSGRVAQRQQRRAERDEEADAFKQQQMAAAAPAVSPGPAAPAASAPTTVEQLTQLAALRDQGVLTESEFEAEKAKILGG